MADDTAPQQQSRRFGWRYFVSRAAMALAALLVLAVGAVAMLDTSAGHRFIIDQIESQRPDDGMVIGIGRIDGSVFRDPVVRDLRIGDPRGQFLTVGEVRIQWRPIDFLLSRRLTINSLAIPRATLARLPQLRETDDDKPILPDFDIRIDRLNIADLMIEPAVGGRQHRAIVTGRANVRAGSADVRLDARLRGGGDRVRLALTAMPDAGEFDIDADLLAPRGGVLAAISGADAPTSAVIRGDGDWGNWRGALLARSGDTPLASVRMVMREGRLTATGRVWPEMRLTGQAARLAAGGIAVDADGRIARRRWDGRISLVSAAIQTEATGGIDMARNRFGALRVDARLRRNDVLGTGITPQSGQLALLLDGSFASPRVEYRLLAQSVELGGVRLVGVRAAGRGVASRRRIALPINLAVTTISGVAPPIDRALEQLSATGTMDWQQGSVSADGVVVRAKGADARLGLRLASGDRTFSLTGTLAGLELGGIGLVDVGLDVNGHGNNGAPVTIGGTAHALVRRFDNGFMRGLAGGGPDVRASIGWGADKVLRLTNIRLDAPLLQLAGSGQRRGDGTFGIAASGHHRRYGPLTLALEGPLARPAIVATLAAPLAVAQLSAVTIRATPRDGGFDLTAGGGSLLGPFAARGAIILPRGGTAVLDVAALTIDETSARGRLAVGTGGLVGQLLVAGGGIDGRLLLSLPGGIQRIVANMSARNASIAGPPPLAVARGQLQATLSLDPHGNSIDASFETVGLSRGPLSIARLGGNVRVVDGQGNARIAIAGSRGRDFSAQTTVAISDGRLVVRGSGSLERVPIALMTPAVLSRREGGWGLAATELRYGTGRVQLSGHMGAGDTRIDAGLDAVPLDLLDIGYPDLGLGGRASGRLHYADADGVPEATLALRVSGLNRAGLLDSSAPVDVAVNAALTGNNAAARAVFQRDGAVIGRAQARVSNMPERGALIDRLSNAPLFAQLRYDSDIARIWRLIGVESLSISGAVELAADVTGTVRAPNVRGVIRARDARVESFQTGTVVSNITAVGQFDRNQLRLRSVRGMTAGGGAITGAGDIGITPGEALTMDIRLDAQRALLIDRDDLVARVTGPVRLSSDASGGTISGRVQLDAGRFRLGQATTTAALPVINVVEENRPADRPAPRQRATPWRLDLAVAGRRGFEVTGLGLDSDWRTDVTVRGDVSNFAMDGTAELVRGEYVFAGRRFELESGTIRFDGSSPPDPVLDIVAVDDVAGIDASIRVRGTGLRPEISFASVPALPEDELLSRILFGASITDISVTEAAQLGLALASLRGGGDLDPINAIRRATGLDRLRILPADTAIGSGTSIAAGKYVTRRVYVEIITDGQGYSATRTEYRVTRWLALLGSISTLGRETAAVRVQRNY